MSYILFNSGSSLSTPVSIANGGTGVATQPASLANLLQPQPLIAPSIADPIDLERAVNEIITTLTITGVIS